MFCIRTALWRMCNKARRLCYVWFDKERLCRRLVGYSVALLRYLYDGMAL